MRLSESCGKVKTKKSIKEGTEHERRNRRNRWKNLGDTQEEGRG
jgi:hypothetical protein